jgi:hypothetical protein
MRHHLTILLASAALCGALACDLPSDTVRHTLVASGDEVGNFPERVEELCDGLPDDIDAIDGLASAYALVGQRSFGDADASLDPGAVRIRLSSWGITADQAPPPMDDSFAPPEALAGGWLFAFELPAHAQTPGVYPLSGLSPGWAESWAGECNGEICGGGGGGGGGAGVPIADQGELEVFVVDDDCVVGAIRDTDSAASGVRAGGFVAQRVELPCVPVVDATCD